MHEALLPKSAVMKTSEEVQEMINHRCNCVIRHNICPGGKMSHTGGTGGQDVFEMCLADILEWEGEEAVEEYLVFMADQTVIAGKHALQRFRTYIKENQRDKKSIIKSSS